MGGPEASWSPDLYIGYFANRYGEQWIFTFDRATGGASLRGGGVDGKTAHVVRDGRVDGLILSPEEAAWLQACWSAASPSPWGHEPWCALRADEGGVHLRYPRESKPSEAGVDR